MVDGRSFARQAVTIADLAYRNSIKEGVRVSERSKAKSSAAKIKPDRYGEALQMLDRSVTALADSMSAKRLMGGARLS